MNPTETLQQVAAEMHQLAEWLHQCAMGKYDDDPMGLRVDAHNLSGDVIKWADTLTALTEQQQPIDGFEQDFHKLRAAIDPRGALGNNVRHLAALAEAHRSDSEDRDEAEAAALTEGRQQEKELALTSENVDALKELLEEELIELKHDRELQRPDWIAATQQRIDVLRKVIRWNADPAPPGRREAQAAPDLRAWVQHLPWCASLPCYGHSDGTVCTVECSRGDKPCDCGLDAALSVPPVAEKP